MADELTNIDDAKEKLNTLVDKTINSLKSLKTTLCEQAQEAARTVIAELKRTKEVAKTIPNEIKEITLELSDITKELTKESALWTFNKGEYELNNETLKVEEIALSAAKQAKAEKDRIQYITNAKKKSRGEKVEKQQSTQEKDELKKLKDKVKRQKQVCKDWNEKVETNIKNINDLKQRLKDLQKRKDILEAQLSPDVALAQAKIKEMEATLKLQNLTPIQDLTQIASGVTSGGNKQETAEETTEETTGKTTKNKKENKTTKKTKDKSSQEAQKEAQQELEEAQEMVEIATSIAEDAKQQVKQIQEEQSSKMDLLKAEYQQMEYGTQVLTYLITNMSIQIPLPSFIGTGSPNPARTIADGNVSYGLLFFILSVVKASAMRFKALANELDYTPTVEMETLTMIPILEGQVKALLAMGPAGATLGV